MLTRVITILLLAITYKMYMGRDATYEDYNLKLIAVSGPYNWLVQKPDGEQVRLDFCKNYPVAELDPQPGYTIEHIKAEYRGCLNVLPINKYLITWKKFDSGPLKGFAIKED